LEAPKQKKTIKLKIKKNQMSKDEIEKKSITKYNSKEEITIKRMMIKFEQRERGGVENFRLKG
jgi:hypothetical protein